MISSASDKELDMANARADIILALDNTAAYESWLYIDNYIEQLEQALANNSKINMSDHKYASEMEDKYLVEHNIVTEFEKWLKTRLQEECKIEIPNSTIPYPAINKKYYVFNECLDRLQELKEGKK